MNIPQLGKESLAKGCCSLRMCLPPSAEFSRWLLSLFLLSHTFFNDPIKKENTFPDYFILFLFTLFSLPYRPFKPAFLPQLAAKPASCVRCCCMLSIYLPTLALFFLPRSSISKVIRIEQVSWQGEEREKEREKAENEWVRATTTQSCLSLGLIDFRNMS